MENKKTSHGSGENKMTTISQEEENYVRMSLLLSGISSRAVRILFDHEFAPSCLAASIKKATNKLIELKKKRIIDKLQWNLLFCHNGDPDSNMFDITLMITLLTNLTPLKHYKRLPLVKDTETAADLGRIKYYRNHISHNKDGKIDNSFFSTAWEDIIQAIGRLGGQNLLDECKELRKKIMEQSTVPWTIRIQISEILEDWKMNNSNFVETRGAKHVLECVQKNSCVTVTGSSGVGKTATLQHVVLQMADEGYSVLLITNPQDIVNFYNPNQKTLFVIDDFCGTFSMNQSDLNNFESVMERIEKLIQNENTKIIVACRLQVFRDDRFDSLTIFRTCVCNLLSEEMCLLQTEKQSIAELYLETKASEIIQYCDLYDCFPLLCKWYIEHPTLNIVDFFKHPFSVFEAEIDKLHKNKIFGKYCALALCVIFNNRLKEEWLTDEVNTFIGRTIEKTCEACSLDRCTSRLILLDELTSLEYTFIKKEKGIYKAIHDTIFDFLAYYFGTKMIKCLIRNAHCEFIMQRFLLERKDDMDQFITVIPSKCHKLYIQRLFDDLKNGRVQCVLNNINMKITGFRKRFLFNLNALEISNQRKLALTCDVHTKDTVLLQCCQYDDIPLIQWCLSRGVDVNKCNCNGVSPFYGSAQEGNTEVVKLLLDNKADINKCRDNGASPLFVACQNNHIEVVKLLLKNKADINLSLDNGASPLFVASQNNNIEVVKVLLDNKADIDKCTDDGSTPLYIACEKNHLEVIKVLLDFKADINSCMVTGMSPLFISCLKNNIEMVKVLLDNKADINKCTENRTSPLFIACQNNHKEIVKILLENKADINKCTDKRASPLYVACQNNHIEIVKLLLNEKADINKCTNEGASPLFVACENNHADIVKVLLAEKADIDKCTDAGASPLFVACQNGHIVIVKVLLQNKAEINKCMDGEISPLIIACKKNHIEIVKVLLDNKADIDMCMDNDATPLFIACQENHKEVVKVLLDNKADMNKCNANGAYPLFVAYMRNHKDIVEMLVKKGADCNKVRTIMFQLMASFNK